MVSISPVSVSDAAPPALRVSGSLFSRLLTSEQVQKICGQVTRSEVWAADVKRKQLPSCSCSSSEHAELITNVIKEASPLRRVIQRIVRCLFGDRMIFSGAALGAAMERAVTEQLKTTNEDIHNRASQQSVQPGKQSTKPLPQRSRACIDTLLKPSSSDEHGVYVWEDDAQVIYRMCDLGGNQAFTAGHAAMVGDKGGSPVGYVHCLVMAEQEWWEGNTFPQCTDAEDKERRGRLCEDLQRWVREPNAADRPALRKWQAANETFQKVQREHQASHSAATPPTQTAQWEREEGFLSDSERKLAMPMFREFLGSYLPDAQGKEKEWVERIKRTVDRSEKMEDRYIVDTCTLGNQEARIFGILDGHGGHEVVDYVSANFVKYFAEHFKKALQQAGQQISNAAGGEPLIVQHALKATCQQLQNEILEKGMQDGTTLTLAVCIAGKIYSANIGDSRQVLLRPDKQYQQLTVDQGLSGVPLKELAKTDGGDAILGKYACQTLKRAKSNGCADMVGKSRLWGAIGGGGTNMFRSMGDVSIRVAKHTPEVSWVERADADYLVLACDGVWDVLTSEQVSAAIRDLQEKQPGIKEAEIAMRITELAYALGSTDNLSMLVVGLPGDGGISTPSQEPYGGLQWVSETAARLLAAPAQSTDEGAGGKHTDAPDVAIARRQAVLAARERAHEMLASSFVPDFARGEMSRRVRAGLR